MRLLILAACFSILMTACGAPSHLIYYHRSVVGFDASASTETRSGQMTFGYDRRLVAVVPKTQLTEKPDDFEAMSVLSCTEAHAGFLSLVKFDERLATGDAATEYATQYKDNPQSSAFQCFRHDESE